jgi:hypothetical protein
MPTLSKVLADIPRSRKSVLPIAECLDLVLTLFIDICQPAISNQIIWVYWAFNITTDLYIISVPLPMLWGSSLKPLKKVGFMIVFSGGILVVVCATLRCVLIVMVRRLFYIYLDAKS